MLAALTALAGAACGAEEAAPVPLAEVGPTPTDPTIAVFDPDRLLEIEIELAEAAWAELRGQGRTLLDILGGECLAQPFPDPFTFFTATITIDGETLENVGVRKKGFLGSLSEWRPSLKISFEEYEADRTWAGLDRLTLNNNQQDPSHINQCIGYALFADAGLPAPRCNFARVIVNGEDLGVYSHVEIVRKGFLARHFGDGSGNLYEGTLSDFRVGWTGTFEPKHDGMDPAKPDVVAMVDAVLAATPSELSAALEPHMDVAAFLSFWALESMVGHWDGYSGNTNNFFLYRDPGTDRFQFLPWGIDAILRDAPPAFGTGVIARRLYEWPETRDRYVDRMRELLDAVWDEGHLLAEIDRMEALIAPYVVHAADIFAGEVELAREFVRTRKAQLLDQLADPAPPTGDPLRDPPCFSPLGTFTGTFQTTWGTFGGGDPFASGSGTMDATYMGNPVPAAPVGATAGWNPDNGESAVLMAGVLGDGNVLLIYVTFDPATVEEHGTVEIDWQHAFGMVLHYVPGPGNQPELVGYLAGGTLSFDDGALADGAPITGHVTATDIVDPPF
jgi:hypothetical protein